MEKYKKNFITSLVVCLVFVIVSIPVYLYIEKIQDFLIAQSCVWFLISIGIGQLLFFYIQFNWSKKGYSVEKINMAKVRFAKLSLSVWAALSTIIILIASHPVQPIWDSGRIMWTIIWFVPFAGYVFFVCKNLFAIKGIAKIQDFDNFKKEKFGWQAITLIVGIVAVFLFPLYGIIFKDYGHSGLMLLIICCTGMLLTEISLW